MYIPAYTLGLFLTLPLLTSAQFGFFEQMFGGNQGGHGHHGHGGQREERNVPSDSVWYKQTYEGASCSNYLCPMTLSCVDKPTHCPCAFPDVEEKFELHGEGGAVCLSRSVWPSGAGGVVGKNVRGGPSFTARKVELARRGLI